MKQKINVITNKLRILTTAQSVMHCYRPGSKTAFPQIKQLVHIKKCILHFYTNLNCSLGKGRECNFKSLFFLYRVLLHHMKIVNRMKKRKGKKGIKVWLDITKAQWTNLTSFWYKII